MNTFKHFSIRNLTLVGIAFTFIFSSCYPWKKNVYKMEVVYTKSTEIKLKSDVDMGVVLTDGRGKKHSAGKMIKGKLKWSNFEVKVTGGSFKNGRVRIDSNFKNIQNHNVEVVCIFKKVPILTDTNNIRLNYKGNVTVYYNGKKGSDGKDRSARLIPIKIGGTGLSAGKEGKDGDAGQNGRDLEIYVRKIFDTAYLRLIGHDLYQVLVKTDNPENDFMTYFAVDSSTFSILAKGGDGGMGGDGGVGTDGRDATTLVRAGEGTNGGKGGNGGNGGRGGNIKIHLAPDAVAFKSSFILLNTGGTGGAAGSGGQGGRGGRNIDGTSQSNGSVGAAGQKGNSSISSPEPEYIYGSYIWPEIED